MTASYFSQESYAKIFTHFSQKDKFHIIIVNGVYGTWKVPVRNPDSQIPWLAFSAQTEGQRSTWPFKPVLIR